MEAKAGDEIVVDGRNLGDPQRKGEIIEVLGEGNVLHYRVRWDDGHDSIFFPGSNAHVVRPGRTKA